MIFSSGNKYCNRCGYKEINGEQSETKENTMTDKHSVEDVLELPPPPEWRTIEPDILEQAGVRCEFSPSSRGVINKLYFPVHSADGKLAGWKGRQMPKSFFTVGNLRGVPKQFFGQQQVGEGGRLLIIVEGESDVLAARQILKDKGKSYNVVGLSFGASSAPHLFKDNYEWLCTFDNVVCIFDQDKAGRDAIDSVVTILPPGKLKIGTHSENDVCDLLAADKDDEFLQALWRAKTYQPEGFVNAANGWERYKLKKGNEGVSWPPDFPTVQKYTEGMRYGEVVTLIAATGQGKSQIVDHVTLDLIHNTEINIGVVKLEQPFEKSVQGLISSEIGANLKIAEIASTVSEEEEMQAFDNLFSSGRVTYLDHGFISPDSESIMKRVEQLIVVFGCKVVFLDHLHMLLTGDGDITNIRQAIDALVHKLKVLAEQREVIIFAVAHVRKAQGKSFEEGEVPTLDDIKESSGVKQLSDTVIAISRDQQAEDVEERNVAQLHVLKSREIGLTGEADKLKFITNSCRYEAYKEEALEF